MRGESTNCATWPHVSAEPRITEVIDDTDAQQASANLWNYPDPMGQHRASLAVDEEE